MGINADAFSTCAISRGVLRTLNFRTTLVDPENVSLVTSPSKTAATRQPWSLATWSWTRCYPEFRWTGPRKSRWGGRARTRRRKPPQNCARSKITPNRLLLRAPESAKIDVCLSRECERKPRCEMNMLILNLCLNDYWQRNCNEPILNSVEINDDYLLSLLMSMHRKGLIILLFGFLRK